MAGDHADSSATASRVPARAGSIVPPKSGFPGPDDAPLNAAVAGGADIDEGDLRPVQQRRRLRRESLPVHHSAGAVTDAVIASIPLITSPGLDRRMRHVRPPPGSGAAGRGAEKDGTGLGTGLRRRKRPVCQDRHPGAVGQEIRAMVAGIADTLGPHMLRRLAEGAARVPATPAAHVLCRLALVPGARRGKGDGGRWAADGRRSRPCGALSRGRQHRGERRRPEPCAFPGPPALGNAR